MHKQKEEKLQRQNLLLSVIGSVNQLLIREKDSARLLQGICNQLVRNRGYHNAWIILLDESGKPVVHAEAGLGQALMPLQELLFRGDLPGLLWRRGDLAHHAGTHQRPGAPAGRAASNTG